MRGQFGKEALNTFYLDKLHTYLKAPCTTLSYRNGSTLCRHFKRQSLL